MQISKHFTLEDLVFSTAAFHLYRIPNEPTPEAIDNLHVLAETILEPIYDYFGRFLPVSCYRSEELNHMLHASPTSPHIDGRAVDLVIKNVHNVYLGMFILHELEFDELVFHNCNLNYPNHGHIHVSIPKAGEEPRFNVKSFDGEGYKKGISCVG